MLVLVATASVLRSELLCGLFTLLRLVLCDEELCYRIGLALSCDLLPMSTGGGFECADLEYQLVDLYDPSALCTACILRMSSAP